MAKMAEKDEVQKFLEKSEDPQWWRKITDELNNKEVRLSKADLEMLKRLRKGGVAAEADFDINEDFSEAAKAEKNTNAISEFNPKRRFIPSKWERLKVQKFLIALKKGTMKTLEEKRKEKQEKREKEDAVWDIWQDDRIVPWKPKDGPKAI